MWMDEDTVMMVPASKESNQRRSHDSKPKLDSMEAWLQREWLGSGLVKMNDRTIYNHHGTIWRFWCMYEVCGLQDDTAKRLTTELQVERDQWSFFSSHSAGVCVRSH
jgi:hypothetical protein